MYLIEDELHGVWIDAFADRESAIEALRRLAAIPWDQEPNRPPCENWRRCGRSYVLIDLDAPAPADRTLALKVSAEGAQLLV